MRRMARSLPETPGDDVAEGRSVDAACAAAPLEIYGPARPIILPLYYKNAMPSNVLLSLIAYSAASIVFIMTPGLDTAIVLRSCTRGHKTGLFAALGHLSRTADLGLCSGFRSDGAADGVACGVRGFEMDGAAYLFYLGVNLIFRPRTSILQTTSSPTRSRKADGSWNAFRRGFLSDMLNPKVGVFYMTFLPQFIWRAQTSPSFHYSWPLSNL